MKYLELPLILPQIPADAIKAHIPTELRSWPRRVKRREGIQKAVEFLQALLIRLVTQSWDQLESAKPHRKDDVGGEPRLVVMCTERKKVRRQAPVVSLSNDLQTDLRSTRHPPTPRPVSWRPASPAQLWFSLSEAVPAVLHRWSTSCKNRGKHRILASVRATRHYPPPPPPPPPPRLAPPPPPLPSPPPPPSLERQSSRTTVTAGHARCVSRPVGIVQPCVPECSPGVVPSSVLPPHFSAAVFDCSTSIPLLLLLLLLFEFLLLLLCQILSTLVSVADRNCDTCSDSSGCYSQCSVYQEGPSGVLCRGSSSNTVPRRAGRRRRRRKEAVLPTLLGGGRENKEVKEKEKVIENDGGVKVKEGDGRLSVGGSAAGEGKKGGRGRSEPCAPPTVMLFDPPTNNTDHVPPTALATLAPAQAQGRRVCQLHRGSSQRAGQDRRYWSFIHVCNEEKNILMESNSVNENEFCMVVSYS
ncbi:uncharacterized protein LOC123515850 [Portunus trituberculatus]|uniref:uncharacterized protein LOC123515850 n=1 Tax=Portunus trituberculatus TaxID=210409 RepID=UPI001E1CC73F|nr:uncharacterized protein LOC123515850 [Portunus trituberculatus]